MGDRRDSGDQPAAADGDGEEVNGVEAPARRHSPWTQVEHLLFLLGLEDHGRGAWRAIAMDYCVSRTPTQVASHAQKYFLRQELTPSRRHKKRPSIHDITRASISPYATSSERDHMRVTLQETVRAGRDMAGASDSNDNSASSSGKSVSSTCLPVSDPIFGQVFAFTVDPAAAATNSSGGVDVTFGVAGAQQMQQVQQMQYTIMHPMHGPTSASTAPGAAGSWTLPRGAVLAPMPMPPGMQLQPAPYPGPMQVVPPQAPLAYMTPAPGTPWPPHPQHPQHGPVQTMQPVYPSQPAMPIASKMLPGTIRPGCATGPVARFAAARRGPAAPHQSAPVNSAPSADAVYSQGMAGAGWVTVPAQGPHGLPPRSGGLSGGLSVHQPAHQPHGGTASQPDAHSQVIPLPQAQVSPVVPLPAQQPQQSWPPMARQPSTDSALASSGKDSTPRDHRGTKRDSETVNHLMHGQQPRQYHARWQPAAPFQTSGTPSAGPHPRPGLQMPLWSAGNGSTGPPLTALQHHATATMGDSNNMSARHVGSSHALVSTLSEPLDVVGGSSGTSELGSSHHVAWHSTVPEAQHGPGVRGEASSPNKSLPPPSPAPFAQGPVGDKVEWPGTPGPHAAPPPMQSAAGDLAAQPQRESSLQLLAHLAAQPQHYRGPQSASLLRSVSAVEAQLPQQPLCVPTAQRLPAPLSAPAPLGSGAHLPPRGLAGGRSSGIADSCGMHASSFQPFAHEAGSWSAPAGDALGAGSLQETGDGIIDYLLGNMPLLADPLLDVFDKSSSVSTDPGSGSAGARAGVAGGGAQ